MKTTKLRVFRDGLFTRIYMPDGTQIQGVTEVKVDLGAIDRPATLTLTVLDFVIDSELGRTYDDAELAKFGLKRGDFFPSSV